MTRALAISIINYQTAEMTLDCIQSVLADLGGIDAEIVVVDNLSGDGSVEEIEGWIAAQPAGTPVRLVRSTTNSGFSGGHNQGMAAVDAAHYLILNSDTRLVPGCLNALLAEARAFPEAGLIAPTIEGEDGHVHISCFRFPSPASELIRGAATGPVTRLLRKWDVPLGIDPHAEDIGWASFACILLNRAMLHDIGPMDEGYFLYFEDAEYCLRARRAGWGIRRAPAARVVHFRGGSAPVKALAQARKRLPAYFYSSRTRFFFQAYGYHGLWAANLMWFAGRGIAGLRRILGRNYNRAKRAEGRDIWTNAFNPLGPRHAPAERA